MTVLPQSRQTRPNQGPASRQHRGCTRGRAGNTRRSRNFGRTANTRRGSNPCTARVIGSARSISITRASRVDRRHGANRHRLIRARHREIRRPTLESSRWPTDDGCLRLRFRQIHRLFPIYGHHSLDFATLGFSTPSDRRPIERRLGPNDEETNPPPLGTGSFQYRGEFYRSEFLATRQLTSGHSFAPLRPRVPRPLEKNLIFFPSRPSGGSPFWT